MWTKCKVYVDNASMYRTWQVSNVFYLLLSVLMWRWEKQINLTYRVSLFLTSTHVERFDFIWPGFEISPVKISALISNTMESNLWLRNLTLYLHGWIPAEVTEKMCVVFFFTVLWVSQVSISSWLEDFGLMFRESGHVTESYRDASGGPRWFNVHRFSSVRPAFKFILIHSLHPLVWSSLQTLLLYSAPSCFMFIQRSWMNFYARPLKPFSKVTLSLKRRVRCWLWNIHWIMIITC